jgi:hypothetical protein
VNLQLEEYTTCGTNQSNENFEVINSGSIAVNLSQITVKFWIDDTNYTSNGADTVVGAVNYGGCFGSACTAVSGVAISALRFSPACGPVSNEQANWEITVSDTDSVSLSAGATWTNIQTAIHINNFPNFNPGTGFWYSPCGVGGGSTYTNNLNYALYYQGSLVTASRGAPPSCRPVPTCTPGGPGAMVAGAQDVVLQEETKTPTLTVTISPTPQPSGTLTATPTATSDDRLLQSIVAAPNISMNGDPIRFQVNLVQPALIHLSLYTIMGEMVYQSEISGRSGLNTIAWVLQNQKYVPVSSGLYLYVLQIKGESGVMTKTGKVVVLH